MTRPSARTAFLLCVALAASAATWHALPRDYFRDDDFLCLFQIVNEPLETFLLTPHGGHMLAVRNAIFVLFARLFGAEPAYFYGAMLFTHLLNVALMFALLTRISGRATIAAFGAVLFGTAPVLGGALTWYAVYGQVLATSATLAVLLLAARAAAQMRALRPGESGLAAALLLAAAFCFGVGIGIALAMPAALAALLPRARRLPPLAVLWLVVPLLYVLSYVAYAQLAPPAPRGDTHALTVVATLVLAAWHLPLGMLVDLVGYGTARLLGGPLPLPYGMPAVLRGAGLLLLLASLWVAWRGPAATRRWLTALWTLLLGCYGAVAIGRFWQWATNPAAATHTRFHYAAAALLALIVGLIAARALSERATRRALPAYLAAWALAALLWNPPLELNAKQRAETALVLRSLRNLIAAAPPGAPVRVQNRAFHAAGTPVISLLDFPGWAGVFAIYYPQNTVQGHAIQFVERSPAVRARFADGRRTAGLLVAPETVPPQ